MTTEFHLSSTANHSRIHKGGISVALKSITLMSNSTKVSKTGKATLPLGFSPRS